jgi:hypothetical protein
MFGTNQKYVNTPNGTAMLKFAIENTKAIVIGAGAGLSTSAGYTYDGERFDKYFKDFGEKYGYDNMYAGGFCRYEKPEIKWAFWARYIWINRYMKTPLPVYDDLYDLVTLRKLSAGMLDKINSNYRHIVMFNGSLIGLGLLGVIPPTTTSLLHNLSTMLFGLRSTRSVLNDDEPFAINAEAVKKDNALIGESAK